MFIIKIIDFINAKTKANKLKKNLINKGIEKVQIIRNERAINNHFLNAEREYREAKKEYREAKELSEHYKKIEKATIDIEAIKAEIKATEKEIRATEKEIEKLLKT